MGNVFFAGGKIGMGFSDLPRGCTELEYLQSDGTQYIDTGVIGKTGLSVLCDFEVVSGDLSDLIIIGCAPASYSPRCYPIASQSSKFAYGYGNWYNSSMTFALNTRYRVNTNFGTSTQSMSVNDSSVVNSAVTTTYDVEFTMSLFGANIGGTPKGYGSQRIYSCQIYDNGTLIRDFVPVLDVNKVACLYDKVNKKFYYNKGTGDFTYNGYFPPDCTELKYIQSSGTQYINTGVTPNANISIRFKFSELTLTQNSDYALLGSVWGQFCLLYASTSAVKWYSGGSTTVNVSTTGINELILTPTSIEVNGTIKNVSAPSSYPTKDICLLNTGDNGAGTNWRGRCKIYGLQIYNGEALVRDFIPCVSDTGVGLYDRVEHKFYGNNGTGSFVGSEVE